MLIFSISPIGLPQVPKWRRQWHPTPVLLSGKSHGRRSLVGCSPRGREESDMTEWLHFHFSLSCIGEGNGNPLQCSCLENPKDRGAWWAVLYGVTQSRTRLKRLSSSSSRFQRDPWEDALSCVDWANKKSSWYLTLWEKKKKKKLQLYVELVNAFFFNQKDTKPTIISLPTVCYWNENETRKKE